MDAQSQWTGLDAARLEAYAKLKEMIDWLAWAEQPPSEHRRSQA
mgnify:CR=1 FL=1